MNLGSHLYKKIAHLSSEDDLDAVALDLSSAMQLKGHILCELEKHHLQDGVEYKFSMISNRMEHFDRKKLIDDQAPLISAIAQSPTASLAPYVWEEMNRRWVQFIDTDISVAHDNAKHIDLALFVPANPNKVICLLAIGVEQQPGRVETAYFQSIAGIIAAKLLGLKSAPSTVVLSQSERLCLVWAASGKTIEEIAVMLALPEHSVSYYFSTICSKLQANTRSHAITKAIRLGLIGLHEIV